MATSVAVPRRPLKSMDTDLFSHQELADVFGLSILHVASYFLMFITQATCFKAGLFSLKSLQWSTFGIERRLLNIYLKTSRSLSVE